MTRKLLCLGCVLVLASSVGLASGLPRLEGPEEVEQYFARHDRQLVVAAGYLRAALFWDGIREAARRFAVPEDLFFGLGLVESSFYPYATSSSGAEGVWQLMPQTSADYGLASRAERFDVGRSTEAAARYLADLYRRFGSWDLALAAYNWGPTRVTEAVEAAGSRRWEVVRSRLRDETAGFVPKIFYLAAHAYPRFQRGEPPEEPVALFLAPQGSSWYGLSRRFGVELSELTMLNRGPLVGGAPVVVPARHQRAAPGETVAQMAARLGIAAEVLSDLNGVEPQEVVSGRSLLIPRGSLP